MVVCGWLAANGLHRVDQDLRIIYSEHTVAVTDLGHIYADLIRYRSTILRAIEADSERAFTRITSSLPVVRDRIEAAIQRYIAASKKTTAMVKVDVRELAELRVAQSKLDAYLGSSDHTIELLKRLWASSAPAERARLRKEAEYYAATVAGAKLIEATVALEELLTIVGQVAGAVRKDGEAALRTMTLMIMTGTIGLICLIWLFPPGRRSAGTSNIESSGRNTPTNVMPTS